MEIKLRPYHFSDVDEFMELACNDQVIRTSKLRYYISREDALDSLKEVAIPHSWYKAIWVEEIPIGFVIIMPRSGDDRCRADVGYALAAEYWGHGITTRAVKMAISEGLKEFPDVVRFQGLVELENKASQKVLDKAGFLKECVLRKYSFNKGETRDMVMYSLLSSDFMP
ncbi:uncharacterized protein LOC142624214 [Castanea sativa]|uniref:uncharacterized protein LOC142624214 n=1 Tax=Castanea sativa TaxID=21020 RepID=UPI003F64CF35